MKASKNRTRVMTTAATGMLGLALIGLASCSSGDSSSSQTSGGSAALQSPLVFVNNTGNGTLSTIALRGDSGNSVVGILGPGVFGNLALGDMQFSLGEWTFVNVSGVRDATSMAQVGTHVATIDPLTGATPIHEINLTTGTRPVHIYRDPTDREVMWSMNDGLPASAMPNAPAWATPGDDLINCNNPARAGGAILGSSVTIIHNSHLGPGATPPTVERTVCVLADGHKVTANGAHSFDVLAQRPTGSPVGTPAEARYIVVSNGTDNSVSVINTTDNLIKQTVSVGTTPGSVMVYYPGAVAAGGQATASLTGNSGSGSTQLLPELLDDHGMPE